MVDLQGILRRNRVQMRRRSYAMNITKRKALNLCVHADRKRNISNSNFTKKKRKRKMKKIFSILLVLVLAFSLCLVSCNNNGNNQNENENNNQNNNENNENNSENDEKKVMTYAEYAAADLESEVLIEAYVQATQGWWLKEGKGVITVYAADEDGAYFIYELSCSEEDAAKLTPGTKIKVNGYKADWAGEIEIIDATFEFVNDTQNFVAEAFDVTSLLGTENLIKHQNKLVTIKPLTVVASTVKGDSNEYDFLYNWDGSGKQGNDIYYNVTDGTNTYTFCVESYLTGKDTDVYKAAESLKIGDVISVEGFLYWYNAAQLHTTKINKVMTYAEYDSAELDSEVNVLVYVQATQSWWDNKITVYAADEDGAYFIYELACSEADAAKLTAGTKIFVSGYKAAWSGEVEIVDATFKFVDDSSYVAEPIDLTDKLASDDLIKYQNQLAKFTGLTVKSVSYKNGTPGYSNDIYVTVEKDGAEYNFCVESYLTAPGTEVYDAFATITAGDVIDVEGFVYWYNGINTHITKVTVNG